MAADLYPTLWRTARVLANARRLKVLRIVLAHSPIAVSQVAARCGLAVEHASQILRALQARGLLRARRTGPWVFYSAEADPAVVLARPLLAAMKDVLQARADGDSRIIRALTAYTHPRRLTIVRAVADGVRRPSDLSRRCRVSPSSLFVHLDKLTRRGIVARRGGSVRLRKQAGRFEAALLAIALSAASASSTVADP